MNDELEQKTALIASLGFETEAARFMAIDRTMEQVVSWVKRSKEKDAPTYYFKMLHRTNDPVMTRAQVRDGANAALAAAGETADPAKEERKRRRGRVYLALQLPDHPWREDTQEVREALLREFGFDDLDANQLAKNRKLADVVMWIEASEAEAQPWVFVRQQLVWNLCEPAWPADSTPAATGEMKLIRTYQQLGKWLKMPDGRVVVHRPRPVGWEDRTEQLRDLLGKEPWTDYSEEGGVEVRIGLGLKDIMAEVLESVAKPKTPGQLAKARIAAILDAQSKRDPVARSIRVMVENELVEDPFASVGE